MARQLNGYARCEGCGTSYAACPDVYECAECEEDEGECPACHDAGRDDCSLCGGRGN